MINNAFSPPKFKKMLYSSDRILDMLDQSIRTFHATYIQGISGIGKTSYMVDWINKRKQLTGLRVYWMDCKEANENILEELRMAICEERNPVFLILDNYEKIAFTNLDQIVVTINKSLKVSSRCCYITKGRLPDYVIGEIAMQRSNLILEEDLLLTIKEMRQYINEYKKSDLDLGGMEFAYDLAPCPITLNLMVMEWEKYHHEFSVMMGYVEDLVMRYLWNNAFAEWTEEEQDVLRRLYPFEKITKEVIQYLYGDVDKYSLLEAFSRKNCFLYRESGEDYVISDKMKIYFEKTCSTFISNEEYKQINWVAIDYYKSRNEYEPVVKICIRIGEYEEALAAICKCHYVESGVKSYKMYIEELRQLPDAVISSSSEAVFWLALNSLINLRLVEFAKWYGIFVDFYNSAQVTSEQWIIIDVEFSFLKFVSPYTTVKEFLHFVEQYHGRYTLDHISQELFKYEKMDMAVFLLMRRWSLEDGLAKLGNNRMVQEFIGERLYALLMVHLGVCYCHAYQMEEAQNYLYIGNQGCRKTGMYGPELLGELIMLEAQRSNTPDGYDILEKKEAIIRTTIAKQKSLRDCDVYYIRIWLQRRNIDKINRWIGEIERDPDENYTLLNAKGYLVRARVLMIQEDLYHAQMILDKLLRYFEELHFEEDRAECYILYSILCYRRHMLDRSVQLFLKAYWMVRQFHFMSIVVEEGIAIQPVMEMVAKRLPAIAYEETYREIQNKVNIRAKFYSKYLVPEEKEKELLTKTEVEILIELDSENTLSQIADKRCISLNTIKQHTKSIYTKLKVNKRNMAIKVAKERGLI